MIELCVVRKPREHSFARLAESLFQQVVMKLCHMFTSSVRSSCSNFFFAR